MIVISDIHGCYTTLIELVRKLPHRNICILGDMIDRGENSCFVVEYIKNNKFKCVLGNHEDMAIQVQEETNNRKQYDLLQWWRGNGGDTTIKSYEGMIISLDDHVNWFKTLPLYVEYTNKSNQHFILSHSNINFVWDKKDLNPNLFRQWCLWSREFDSDLYGGSRLGDSKNIIGHTPKKIVTTEGDLTFIDTGCVYHKHGYGNLSAYDLETGKIYTQEFID